MKIGKFLWLLVISCVFVIPTLSQPPADWPPMGGETQKDNLDIQSRRPRGPKGLDKASLKELDSLRRVDDADRSQYAEFLRGDNTGIFKLFPDQGCVQKGLIRVDGDCNGFVPDSSLYTFRAGKYGGGDIGYFKGLFISKGLFSQSIMVSLGDIAVGDVNETHPAVKNLINYVLPVTPAEAEAYVKLFAKGVTAGGYLYAGSVDPATGPTFAVRKIEFKKGGKDIPYKLPTGLAVSLERFLRYEERKDTVYIFRVIRKDDAGVFTLVWKQLSRKDAPAIIFQKGDKYPDFGSTDVLRN